MGPEVKQFPLIEDFLHLVSERQSIHNKRKKGLPAPWSNDQILTTYRFTNILREDDRVTKWIHTNWLKPNSDHQDLWFAMYVARVFNRVETLKAIGLPLNWAGKRRQKVTDTLTALRAADVRLFNPAYMVTTHKKPISVFAYYLKIFDTLWERRAYVRPKPDDTLRAFYTRLTEQDGIASFMGGQVVADIKWVDPLIKAKDWATFAVPGPGSKRGLCRLTGRPVSRWWAWNEQEWHDTLMYLRKVALPLFPKGLRKMDSQNLQGCLCEFDKYMRAKSGDGRPKQKFKPSMEAYV